MYQGMVRWRLLGIIFSPHIIDPAMTIIQIAPILCLAIAALAASTAPTSLRGGGRRASDAPSATQNTQSRSRSLLSQQEANWFLGELDTDGATGTGTGAVDLALNKTWYPCHPYEMFWADLTEQQKGAARVLSYDQLRWDDETALEDPDSIALDWWANAPKGEPQLSPSELTAAQMLGYNEGSWEDHYNFYDWGELPTGLPGRSDNKNVQMAAVALGYNQRLWNGELLSATEELAWANLTAVQKEAAGIFGYDECLWDRVEEEEEEYAIIMDFSN